MADDDNFPWSNMEDMIDKELLDLVNHGEVQRPKQSQHRLLELRCQYQQQQQYQRILKRTKRGCRGRRKRQRRQGEEQELCEPVEDEAPVERPPRVFGPGSYVFPSPRPDNLVLDVQRPRAEHVEWSYVPGSLEVPTTSWSSRQTPPSGLATGRQPAGSALPTASEDANQYVMWDPLAHFQPAQSQPAQFQSAQFPSVVYSGPSYYPMPHYGADGNYYSGYYGYPSAFGNFYY